MNGDIVDRGPQSRAVLDLLMRLEMEAQASGGRVHVLLGNHVVMNLTGDLRYVSIEEFSAFTADEDPRDRERGWQRFANQGGNRDAFEARYPDGFFGHLRAFGPQGTYGSWLLQRPVLVVINRVAFVHGGLPASLLPNDAASLEKRYLAPLRVHAAAWHQLVDAGVLDPREAWDRQEQVLQGYLNSTDGNEAIADPARTIVANRYGGLSASDSPVWYRATASCNPVIEVDNTKEVLRSLGADQAVIGHTPTRGSQVRSRMGGRVVMLDTGMLGTHYGGVAAALVIEAGNMRAHYAGDATAHTLKPETRLVGTRPRDLPVDQLEAFLSEAPLVHRHKVKAPAGSYELVTLSQGGITLRARFNSKDSSRGRAKRRARSDTYEHDLAAYRHDRLLDLRLIPATVLRQIGEKAGALLFVPELAIDELQRSSDGLGGDAACDLSDQLELVYAFDALILNDDRRSTTLWYDTTDWRPLLVDHSRSFRNRAGVPSYLRDRQLTLTGELRRRLQELDVTQLRRELGRWLTDDQIAALLRRRDRLLE